ncbi:hypothetical protein [Microvirga thermotolerans]|uniref:Uncharacterized protein n=1 Tax=Microvirga thermotolerans TaxID=2651334 RepID=A0A5P9K0X2_9HYPH|nr:hypothetical protein [Microvirga thermotolerans]QFU17320.1 hypothetical protein GDR74_14420 [Microvirga thermotolerans]
MRRLVWLAAAFMVGLWSLVAWGVYGLVDFLGSTMARNADVVTAHPGAVEWLSWILGAVRNLGLAAVVFVWGLVALLILAVPAAVSFVTGRAVRPAGPTGWNDGYPRPGYRDVTPQGMAAQDVGPAPERELPRIERH